MSLTIHLDEQLARKVRECARREHKSISDWFKERVRPETDRAGALAAMEARAAANGHPPGWLALYGSLADDDAFAAPARGMTRAVESLGGGESLAATWLLR